MKINYLIFIMIFSIFSIVQAEEEPNLKLPNNLKRLKILKPSLLTKELYKMHYKLHEESLTADLNNYGRGIFQTYKYGDFNKNNIEDVFAVYLDLEQKKAYLLFFEKRKNIFEYVTNIPLSNFIAFIKKTDSKNILKIVYESNSDWIDEIQWNGNNFIFIKDDYGP